jgi:hypothetical protein
MTDAETRIRDTTSRVDAYLAERAEQERRREQDDRRSQEQIDAQTRLDTQAKFDDALTAYGERCPAPVAGADPRDYQFALLKLAKSKLSRTDERPVRDGSTTKVSDLAGIKLSQLSDSLLDRMKPHFLDAVRLQGAAPHVSTLPPEGFVARYETDDTGVRQTKFFGRESFIRDFTRPGFRVERIVDPTTRQAIWGKPFSRA